MRVAIANDLRLAVEACRRALGGEHEIAWIARDGGECVVKCKADPPDVLLLDLRMPVHDGVECTRRIMRDSPCAILVVTATVAGNFDMAFEAMGAGALDAVDTPVFDATGKLAGVEQFLEKLRRVARMVRKDAPPAAAAGGAGVLAPARPAPAFRRLPPLIAIGCSTGGPQALASVLGAFPADFPGAVVIVQHVDVGWASGLASWLGGQAKIAVRTAVRGDIPKAGTALLAATNDHLVVRGADGALDYTPDPKDQPYRPSVSVFLRSALQHWGRPAIAALLTGMGRDGADALLEANRAGWFTIAQDEATSVVYGMPKAAAQLGAASRILPLPDIGPVIRDRIGQLAREGGSAS